MGLDDTLSDLVDDAYVAALDEARWPGWAERVVEALGGTGTCLGVVDSATGEIPFRYFGRFSARTYEDYHAGMAALDPQTRFVRGLDRATLYVDRDHLDYDHAETSEYMAWQASVAGMRAHLGGVVLLDGGRLKVGLVAHRREQDGPVPAEARDRLRAILPRVAGAWELGIAHAAKLQAAWWDGLLARQTEPAALVDARGRMLRMTPALEHLLAANDGLAMRGGMLHAGRPEDDRALQALLARVSADERERIAGGTRAMRRSGRAAYIVTAYPLARHRHVVAPAEEAAALVIVVDPAGPPPNAGSFHAEAFGLTPREGELATTLMAGHSVESAAATLGIALATARVHLRALFAKTGTGRQAELVRLLARAAPVL